MLDYDRLVSQPEAMLRRLYEALSERWFDHDFDHVAYDEPDYDDMLGMPGCIGCGRKWAGSKESCRSRRICSANMRA